MTEYHALSVRINGVTVDLDGVDKSRIPQEDMITFFREMISMLREELAREQDGGQVL